MKTTSDPSAPAPCSPPPCRFLRTKRMYIPALAEGALNIEADPNDQSFYWCNKTLAALGQDDNPVHPCQCHSGRSCYEA